MEHAIALFADKLATGVLVTGPDLDEPGPTIRYVNDAFLRITGYAREELLNGTPRMLQGPETNRLVRRDLLRALRAGQCYHCVLTNYRRSGEAYLCEIAVRPMRNRLGEIDAFIAFEREVVRRQGRPGHGAGGRYRAVDPQAERELDHAFITPVDN